MFIVAMRLITYVQSGRAKYLIRITKINHQTHPTHLMKEYLWKYSWRTAQFVYTHTASTMREVAEALIRMLLLKGQGMPLGRESRFF